ncbi:MAG: sigma-70 family RNA polymerase sigma factor [Heyndrickxia sp.]
MISENKRMIKKAIKGNKNAFEQLIKQHYEQIYRTAFLYVHNESDALDVVQDATYRAYCSIHSLRNPEYFMTWLTRIVIRCAAEIVKKRNTVVSITEEMLSGMTSPQQNYVESMYLLEALKHIKENYRTAIILFYYYDYPIKTICGIMDLPEGTVKTYLSRGKAALKSYFKEGEENHG